MKGIFEAISNFFKTIYDIINFVFSALKSLFFIIKEGIGYVTDMIGILPSALIAIGLVLVVVCVLYKILGRESES